MRWVGSSSSSSGVVKGEVLVIAELLTQRLFFLIYQKNNHKYAAKGRQIFLWPFRAADRLP